MFAFHGSGMPPSLPPWWVVMSAATKILHAPSVAAPPTHPDAAVNGAEIAFILAAALAGLVGAVAQPGDLDAHFLTESDRHAAAAVEALVAAAQGEEQGKGRQRLSQPA